MPGPTDLPVVDMFVDEAGTTRDSSFVVAMFCTTRLADWRGRFQSALDDERYSHTIHFKEISSNPRNGRYRVSKRLVAELALRTDWWGHYTYVNRALVDTRYFSGSADIEYNKWLADLIRMAHTATWLSLQRPHRPSDKACE